MKCDISACVSLCFRLEVVNNQLRTENLVRCKDLQSLMGNTTQQKTDTEDGSGEYSRMRI